MTMRRVVVAMVFVVSTPSFSSDFKDSDIPLWERCYELVELDRNVGGFFTTSLKESAYAGSCSGTLKTISVMSEYTSYRCTVPAVLEAALQVVDERLVSIKEAIELFCR